MRTSKRPSSATPSELIPGEDTVIYMDDLWYTTSGAIKVMGVGKTTLTNEIKNKNIEVFNHPKGHLFSKPAIISWIAKRTQKVKR